MFARLDSRCPCCGSSGSRSHTVCDGNDCLLVVVWGTTVYKPDYNMYTQRV